MQKGEPSIATVEPKTVPLTEDKLTLEDMASNAEYRVDIEEDKAPSEQVEVTVKKKKAIVVEESHDMVEDYNSGTGAWADEAYEREYENAEYGDELSDGSYKMHPDSGYDPG